MVVWTVKPWNPVNGPKIDFASSLRRIATPRPFLRLKAEPLACQQIAPHRGRRLDDIDAGTLTVQADQTSMLTRFSKSS